MLRELLVSAARRVAEQTGISVAEIEALIYAGLPPGHLTDAEGRATALFEDATPSREELMTLLTRL